MELNAQPDRLDFDDGHCRMAPDEGMSVVISSDAHSIFDFNHLQFGVEQARLAHAAKRGPYPQSG